jgi:hypothetical protein
VLLFLIGAAALPAAIGWAKVRRITRSAYEFAEVIATSKMSIYYESRVQIYSYPLLPLRKQIEALKTATCRVPTYACGQPYSGDNEPRAWPPIASCRPNRYRPQRQVQLPSRARLTRPLPTFAASYCVDTRGAFEQLYV